ncbi:MAG: response regulator [Candidatus Omnitrophota bacterium]
MNKKILIIDDDPTVVKLIKTRLEANGYGAIVAKDGREGLHQAKTHKPDLILLDVLMPDIDGYTLVKELKKDEELRTIPVIIITIKEQLQDLFKQEGVKDYLVKPINTQELLAKVRNYFGEPCTDSENSLSSDNQNS